VRSQPSALPSLKSSLKDNRSIFDVVAIVGVGAGVDVGVGAGVDVGVGVGAGVADGEGVGVGVGAGVGVDMDDGFTIILSNSTPESGWFCIRKLPEGRGFSS